jgi:GNAT superfamily N-acetyltransferase
VFVPLGIPDLPPPATAEQRAGAWRLLVVGRPVEGFAVLALLPATGDVHLEPLSVHPAAARQGRGAALLEAAVDAARDAGAARVTLTTYADVPWNGPWYARHGFAELAEPPPELAAVRAAERAAGLDRHGRRVVMGRPVARPAG